MTEPVVAACIMAVLLIVPLGKDKKHFLLARTARTLGVTWASRSEVGGCAQVGSNEP
jgi:hypothetical protein